MKTGARLSKLNHHLYRHYDLEGNLLYVGISLGAITRLYQHSITLLWFTKITRIEIQHYSDRDSVLKAEREAIVKEKPQYNSPKLDAKSKSNRRVKSNPGIYIGFFVDTEVDDALKSRAVSLGSDKSKLVRQAINAWLLKNKPKSEKG